MNSATRPTASGATRLITAPADVEQVDRLVLGPSVRRAPPVAGASRRTCGEGGPAVVRRWVPHLRVAATHSGDRVAVRRAGRTVSGALSYIDRCSTGSGLRSQGHRTEPPLIVPGHSFRGTITRSLNRSVAGRRHRGLRSRRLSGFSRCSRFSRQPGSAASSAEPVPISGQAVGKPTEQLVADLDHHAGRTGRLARDGQIRRHGDQR
jgi:hypothetical protein